VLRKSERDRGGKQEVYPTNGHLRRMVLDHGAIQHRSESTVCQRPLREKRALLEEEHEDDKEVGESYPVI